MQKLQKEVEKAESEAKKLRASSKKVVPPPLPSPSSSDPAATNALKKRCEDAERKLKLAKANAATLELRVKELEESAMSSPKPSSIPSSKSLSASKGSDRNENILEPINGGNVLSGGEQSASTRERELLKQLTNERQARAMYQRDSRDKQKQTRIQKQLSSFAGSTSFRGGGGAPSAFQEDSPPPPSSSKELYSVIRMLPLLRVFNNNNNNNNNVCRRHLILPCKLKVAAVIKQRMFQRLTTTARTREEEREAYSSPAISDAHKIRLYSPREAKVLSTAHQRPTGEEEDEEESVSTIRETLSLEAAPKSSARPPSPSPWKANLAGLPRLSNTNEKKVVEAPSSSSRAKRTSSHGWSRTKTIGR